MPHTKKTNAIEPHKKSPKSHTRQKKEVEDISRQIQCVKKERKNHLIVVTFKSDQYYRDYAAVEVGKKTTSTI